MMKRNVLALILFIISTSFVSLPSSAAALKCSAVFLLEKPDQPRLDAIQMIRNFFDQPAANHEIRTEITVLNDGEAIITSYSGVEYESSIQIRNQVFKLNLTLMPDPLYKGEILFSLEDSASRIRFADLSSIHWINDIQPRINPYSVEMKGVNALDSMSHIYRANNLRNRVFKNGRNLVVEVAWPKEKDGKIIVTKVEFVKETNGMLTEIILERRILEGSKITSTQKHFTVGPVVAEPIH